MMISVINKDGLLENVNMKDVVYFTLGRKRKVVTREAEFSHPYKDELLITTELNRELKFFNVSRDTFANESFIDSVDPQNGKINIIGSNFINGAQTAIRLLIAKGFKAV